MKLYVTKTLIFTIALFSFSMNANATIAGKNVVLVHGLMVGDFSNNPTDEELPGLADDYWNEYWGSRAEAKLYWPSTGRITGRIKDLIRTQIKTLEANRTCADGCVFVTHSTGDLVTRDLLTRLGQWQVNQNNFRVLAVLDFAGAGVGSELADLATNIAEGNGVFNGAQRAAIRAFVGVDLTPDNLGVLRDLRPSAARAIATQNVSLPRLRFVGGGTAFVGLTKAFLPGESDSVVSFHSACGSTRKDSYNSCSASVRDNGVIRSSDAPPSLLFNHFPVLMGEGTDHFEVISNERSGDYTTVVNDTTLGGLSLDFVTRTSRKWWAGFRRVRLVQDGDRKSMSANVYDTLNL